MEFIDFHFTPVRCEVKALIFTYFLFTNKTYACVECGERGERVWGTVQARELHNCYVQMCTMK